MVAAKRINKSQFLFLLLILNGTSLFGQVNYLNRKVSLDIPNCSLEVALREIGKAGKFRFSYDAGLIPGDRQVHITARDIPIHALLKEILGRNIGTREVGNYVILVRNKTEAREKQPFSHITVAGTVSDAQSHRPLASSTIYEVDNKWTALTNGNGAYKLVIPSGKKVRGLAFCKSGYADTVLFIRQAADRKIDVLLRPIFIELSRMDALRRSVVIKGTDSLALVKWLVPHVTLVNAQNLEVRTARTFQASIIPYIGTNWRVTGSITNRFSLNLLAGYTGGVQGFELGGLLNVTRRTTSGLQICGLGNIVGGQGRGWQIGGIFNFDLGNFDGVQAAVGFNYAADTMSGVQIGGLVNYAGIVNGFQIGLVNVAKTIDRGTLIGIFNYVKTGYHLFELSGNELFYGNVAFKSGTRAFYTFVQLGMGGSTKLQCSYGVGTIFTLKNKLSMNLDASAGFVLHPVDTEYHGLLLKFNPALEHRFAKHFAIFGGPAYNCFVFTKGKPSATLRGLSTYDFYFSTTEHASVQMWIGGVVGIRF